MRTSDSASHGFAAGFVVVVLAFVVDPAFAQRGFDLELVVARRDVLASSLDRRATGSGSLRYKGTVLVLIASTEAG